MKKILVPTDFSPVSENALTFACEFNKVINAKIIIYHTYFIPVPATDIPVVVPSNSELKQAAFDSLKKLENKYINKYPGCLFDVDVSEGFAEHEIVSAGKKLKCDLVIMGTRGASGMQEVLMGSNTSKVIENSICPVIAVPENARMNGIKKIVFAANYGMDDFENVFDLIDIARMLDSEIILLHISTGKKDKDGEYMELEGFKRQIESESKYQKLSFKLIQSEDVHQGLNSFLEEVKADLLAVSMRNRSFTQKLFSRSFTKRMVYHTSIPLLAFHTGI